MAGRPGAAHNRLPADVPRARHGRPGVPRRPLAVGEAEGVGSFRTPARVRAAGTSVAWRWMQVWLVAAGERCVSSRATTSTGTPRRISPDDHPYRARWHVSSLLHAADRAGADQGSDRRNAAVSVPVAWRPSPVRAGRRARAPGRRSRGQMPGSAGERRDWGLPTSASLVHAHMVGAWWAAYGPCRRTCRWWPASTTRFPGRLATTRRGPGMRHGGPACSSPAGRRPAPGRRGSAWTTVGCATGARRWKASPPRRCRDSPRRG